MEKKLISKKELLEVTGISYGQLYRWKRKKIIPEEWFIKTATFTGQETFFPKYDILERIEKIIELKDKLSLDELAEVFSTNPENFELNEEVLLEKDIVSLATLRLYKYNFSQIDKFNFSECMYLKIFDELIKIKGVSVKDVVKLIYDLKSKYPKIDYESYRIIVLSKYNIDELIIVMVKDDILHVGEQEIIKSINLGEIINLLKKIEFIC